MKAIFIAYNQAFNEEIVEVLNACGQRGYTKWDEVEGCGHIDGEPHLGNHAWPVSNQVIITIVPDEKLEDIMAALRDKDEKYQDLGLRAFIWNIESMV